MTVQKNASLLIVEDDVDTAHAMERLLQRRGYRTTSAFTLAQAIAAVERDPFDLLVVDLLLPDGSGLDLLSQLEPPRPGAIAVSACATEEDHARCLSAGFAAHIAKPLSFEVLAQTIESVLAQPTAKSQRPAAPRA